ncbi:MAG: methylenetetrahydrofolate--tRNA-(uracil(54)-C(5))-methyltransferase (FADH(2)-oxidizing) TrmFO [Eubacteriales bacterium]
MNDLRARIKVIGAGLAGCEAAFQAARAGVAVDLYEMKPQRMSPAHHSPQFAELVCSNSLRSNQLANAVGLLKAELSAMHSLIMDAAYRTQVPAGSALAVDRELFSAYVTTAIRTHPLITVHTEEVGTLDKNCLTVVATGPLTDGDMAEAIRLLCGDKGELYFYDAVAPIVDFSTINTDIAFFASRYGKGAGEDYLNCPLTKEQYDAFYTALITAKEAPLKDFDAASQKEPTVFEGCMPVEVMARRGYDTLRYGPMKPVGLPLPGTGREAYAIVQLRRENAEGTMYNMVGFQTHLTFGEQQRVFRMIPGLEAAEFFRYGVMHRNTFLHSPGLLTAQYNMATFPSLYFAGQMTGVEGYVESAASGYVAGLSAARQALGRPVYTFPRETVIGALAHYISHGGGNFQPMNANFGLLPPLSQKVKGPKIFRYEAYARRSLSLISQDRLYYELKESE